MSTIVLAVLGVIFMAITMVVMDLEEAQSKKEVSLEEAATEQAIKVTKVLAQLDSLSRKAGN
ncbi:hypothetical protein [Bacillus anthracis]